MTRLYNASFYYFLFSPLEDVICITPEPSGKAGRQRARRLDGSSAQLSRPGVGKGTPQPPTQRLSCPEASTPLQAGHGHAARRLLPCASMCCRAARHAASGDARPGHVAAGLSVCFAFRPVASDCLEEVRRLRSSSSGGRRNASGQRTPRPFLPLDVCCPPPTPSPPAAVTPTSRPPNGTETGLVDWMPLLARQAGRWPSEGPPAIWRSQCSVPWDAWQVTITGRSCRCRHWWGPPSFKGKKHICLVCEQQRRQTTCKIHIYQEKNTRSG